MFFTILSALAIIAVSLCMLVFSADKFVESAAGLAKSMGISTLTIGMTVVAFGTSAPEALVSTYAALEGSPELAIGNAIGSNIANMALVIGATLMVAGMAIPQSMRRKEIPLLLGATLLGLALLSDKYFSRIDGVMLVAALVATTSYLIYSGKKAIEMAPPIIDLSVAGQHTDTNPSNHEAPTSQPKSATKTWMVLIISLLVLLVSARVLTSQSVMLANLLGVPEVIIGLTLIALGTSLPELAASIASAFKGHSDIALGNVVGSNIFNLLLVLPITALLAPGHISPVIFDRDYMAMILITALLATFIYFNRQLKLTRKHGFLLLFLYLGYMLLLYQQTQGVLAS